MTHEDEGSRAPGRRKEGARMVDVSRLPEHAERGVAGPPGAGSPERALKDFRYVVASVNDNALKVWAELWKELEAGVTDAGLVSPEMRKGFTPSCGWPEFLEKVWLLKHYLDYTNHFCREESRTERIRKR